MRRASGVATEGLAGANNVSSSTSISDSGSWPTDLSRALNAKQTQPSDIYECLNKGSTYMRLTGMNILDYRSDHEEIEDTR